jgi:outer membrane immunogenic protein
VGFASKTTTLNGFMYPDSFAGQTSFAPDTFSVKTTWDASVRGRAGYLITPSFLLYATGGPAWLHVESTSACSTAVNGVCGGIVAGIPFTPPVITNSDTKVGWTVGGGIEAMLWSNWLARAEYRYADYGTITNTNVRTGPGDQTVTYDLAIKTHTVLFGLAYKFGGLNPVVIK